MKYFIILFVTFFAVNQNVNCINVFEFIGSKITDFTNGLDSILNGIVNKIKNVFTFSVTHDDIDRLIEQRIRRSFDDYVEKPAASTKVPEYFNLMTIKQTFDDFLEITASKTKAPECFNLMSDEPTALMTTPQLATLHGKNIQSHVVKTKDNYLLTLHRIQNENKLVFMDNTVLLHHGLMGSSADWIILGPRKSLPYILCDAGYDVWMTNARGNYYSRRHLTQRVNSTGFWKFSFQEMGKYDLPAVIDFIRNKKNNNEKINYIGHSLGATALLVLLSTNPLYNAYLRMGVLLAPLAFMSNIQGPLRVVTSMPNHPPNQLLKLKGDTEFLPSSIPKTFSSKFCAGPKMFCTHPLLFFAGSIWHNELIDPGFLARLLYHVPAGASTNTILHYGQLVQSGKFHKFGQPLAEFPLKRVKLPIVLITSTDDWLSTVPDVMRLYYSIANPIGHYVIRDKKITHTEFVWGPDADVVVFKKVIEFLAKGINYTYETFNEV